jgi:hypothetical protein
MTNTLEKSSSKFCAISVIDVLLPKSNGRPLGEFSSNLVTLLTIDGLTSGIMTQRTASIP